MPTVFPSFKNGGVAAEVMKSVLTGAAKSFLEAIAPIAAGINDLKKALRFKGGCLVDKRKNNSLLMQYLTAGIFKQGFHIFMCTGFGFSWHRLLRRNHFVVRIIWHQKHTLTLQD